MELKILTIANNKKIHFGNCNYEDFLIHKDNSRRQNYRKRASSITDKDGKLTYNDKNSPNFWAYHLLW